MEIGPLSLGFNHRVVFIVNLGSKGKEDFQRPLVLLSVSLSRASLETTSFPAVSLVSVWCCRFAVDAKLFETDLSLISSCVADLRIPSHPSSLAHRYAFVQYP